MNNCKEFCNGYPSKCQSCPWGDGMIPMWRRAKAGHAFGKEAVVIYDGDPDPRLVKCAICDCKYILVEDLKKLPIDEQK